jgi:hypothetical protein
MKKLLPLLTLGLFAPLVANAVCPICTVAVAAGIGLSRWLGIDDSITGLWIGGLVVSMVTWTLSWFDKKNIRFRWRAAVTTVGYYLLVVVPLYFMGLVANPTGAIYGGWLDKLLLGIVVGSLGFWAGAEWYFYLKEKNGGHAQFPFQKVVMPIAPLVLSSIIFYLIVG